MNASRNMPKMMRSILLTGTKGIFAKKKNVNRGRSLITDASKFCIVKQLSTLARKDNQIIDEDPKSIKEGNEVKQINQKTKVLVRGKKPKPIRPSALFCL